MSIIELFGAKNRWKKHQIFEKLDDFQNRPSCSGYTPCKGYSLCKMVSLVQKLKCLKTGKNISISTLELFCAKNRWKKHQIFEKLDDFQNRPSCSGYTPCKGYSLCKMVSLVQKLKCLKTGKNISISTLELFCAKNRWEKHQIFQQSDDFENRPSCKFCSPCKSYSLCKMLSLGQKLKCLRTCKKHIYKHTRVVLSKRPLQKTPNIREMRRF